MYMVAPDSAAHFDGGPHPHLALFQRPFVQTALPLLASVALHAGLILFAIATYTVVSRQRPLEHEPTVIPDIGIEGPSALATPPITSQSAQSLANANLPVVLDADPTEAKMPRGDLAGILNAGGGNNSASANGLADTLIGVSARPGGDSGLPGSTGAGDLKGLAFGDPNGVSFMKLPAGGFGSGPRVGARRIIFLCDASGSMIPTFDTLRVQLRKATDPLRPNFSYNVIFFTGGSAAPRSLDAALRPATPEFKRRTTEFLDRISPVGETNPLPALQLAFQQKPDLIYLLTDGDFPDNKAVSDLIDQLNPTRHVKINTILFVPNKAAAKENAAFAETLKKIATDNGGQSKVADATQLD